jgi:hypothetical protein
VKGSMRDSVAARHLSHFEPKAIRMDVSFLVWSLHFVCIQTLCQNPNTSFLLSLLSKVCNDALQTDDAQQTND